MRHSRNSLLGDLARNPVLVGSILLVAGIVGVFLTYNANRGLPFVPVYEISAEVPDAAELVEGSEVRIGGAHVGQVKAVEPVAGRDGRRAHARLDLALERDLANMPADTEVHVRPRSILGAKYVELLPGTSAKEVLPGGTLGLDRARDAIELDESLDLFDAEGTRALRRTVVGLGDGLAGRGSAINETVGSVARLVPAAERVLTVVVEPDTQLARAVRAAAATAAAVAPAAQQLGSLFDGGATTLAALDASGDALGDSIAGLVPVEVTGTRALTRARPVLADAAAIARALREGTPLLEGTSRRVAAALRAGTPALRRTPALTTRLDATLAALRRVARDPSASGAVRKLLAAVASGEPTVRFLAPAQTRCNLLALAMRNASSALSDGDAAGGWLNFTPVLGTPQAQQSPAPSEDLHVNPYPHANESECEPGNEPFAPGQAIGNPAGEQSRTTETTAPPAAARARARRAGLLDPVLEVRR